MDNLDENVNLIKGLVKDKMRKYGDLLVNLYEKVKKGGALETTSQEKEVLFKMANKYGDLHGMVTPINQVTFSNIFNGIRDNVVVKQMIQWGGVKGVEGARWTPQGNVKINKINRKGRYHKVGSKRLRPLYKDYLEYITKY